MFTPKRISLPALSGDWNRDGPLLLQSLHQYLLSLEQPNSLHITAARIGDEYTCTPTLYGATTAGSQTYAASTQGTATQIGRIVFLHDWRVTLTAKGGTMAGVVRIGGLPVPSVATGGNLTGSISISAYDNINLSAGYSQLGLIVPSASSELHLYESGDNVAAQEIGSAAISNTSSITLSGFYRCQ